MSTFDQSRPLRVAVIGSGPSGLFLAEALLKTSGVPLTIDVSSGCRRRTGSCVTASRRTTERSNRSSRPSRRFSRTSASASSATCASGPDLTLADAQRFYDVIAYAVGASADRSLNIPGEELAGSLSATEFVAWYSGHPDHANRTISRSRLRRRRRRRRRQRRDRRRTHPGQARGRTEVDRHPGAGSRSLGGQQRARYLPDRAARPGASEVHDEGAARARRIAARGRRRLAGGSRVGSGERGHSSKNSPRSSAISTSCKNSPRAPRAGARAGCTCASSHRPCGSPATMR